MSDSEGSAYSDAESGGAGSGAESEVILVFIHFNVIVIEA